MTPEELRFLLVDIRIHRRRASQKTVANRMHIHQQALNRMEHGDGADMLLTTFLDWTEALGMELVLVDRSHDGQTKK